MSAREGVRRTVAMAGAVFVVAVGVTAPVSAAPRGGAPIGVPAPPPRPVPAPAPGTPSGDCP